MGGPALAAPAVGPVRAAAGMVSGWGQDPASAGVEGSANTVPRHCKKRFPTTFPQWVSGLFRAYVKKEIGCGMPIDGERPAKPSVSLAIRKSTEVVLLPLHNLHPRQSLLSTGFPQ